MFLSLFYLELLENYYAQVPDLEPCNISLNVEGGKKKVIEGVYHTG